MGWLEEENHLATSVRDTPPSKYFINSTPRHIAHNIVYAHLFGPFPSTNSRDKRMAGSGLLRTTLTMAGFESWASVKEGGSWMNPLRSVHCRPDSEVFTVSTCQAPHPPHFPSFQSLQGLVLWFSIGESRDHQPGAVEPMVINYKWNNYKNIHRIQGYMLLHWLNKRLLSKSTVNINIFASLSLLSTFFPLIFNRNIIKSAPEIYLKNLTVTFLQ